MASAAEDSVDLAAHVADAEGGREGGSVLAGWAAEAVAAVRVE